MFTVSPYELLRASIPKPAPTMTTNYDLFSAAHQAYIPDPFVSPNEHDNPYASALPPSSPSKPIAQAQSRTHYIEEIKARHSMANRHLMHR